MGQLLDPGHPGSEPEGTHVLRHSKYGAKGAAEGRICAQTLQIMGSKVSTVRTVRTVPTVPTVPTVRTVRTIPIWVSFSRVGPPPNNTKEQQFAASLRQQMLQG